MAPKVLVVLTSHDKIDATGKPTGWYLPELAHPYDVLAPHTEITIASPKGGVAPLDQGSVEAFKEDASSVEFLKSKKSLWENTEKLESFLGRAKDFDALFFPGGHGPMYDLATDPTSQKLINEFVAANKVVSAVCHGPAAFVNVKLPDGEYLLNGSKVTGFSNSEETTVGLMDAMPFSLEDKLNEASGGKFEKASEDWADFVLVERDGKLITGQNPASAGSVGKAILKAISA